MDGDLNGQNLVVEEGGGVFQVGPTESFGHRIEVSFADLRASGNELNLGRVLVASIGSARQALASTDRAITNVANERGKMGAVQNRLDVTIAYTENEIESIQASEASIRDADIAVEVTEFIRRQILLQSRNAMLVQANASSVAALSLLLAQLSRIIEVKCSMVTGVFPKGAAFCRLSRLDDLGVKGYVCSIL